MPANEAPQQIGYIPVRKEERHVGPSSNQSCSTEAQPQDAGAGLWTCHHAGRQQRPRTNTRKVMVVLLLRAWGGGNRLIDAVTSQGQIKKSQGTCLKTLTLINIPQVIEFNCSIFCQLPLTHIHTLHPFIFCLYLYYSQWLFLFGTEKQIFKGVILSL